MKIVYLDDGDGYADVLSASSHAVDEISQLLRLLRADLMFLPSTSAGLESDTVRMGRFWNFIRNEYRIEYRQNFEYESNIESNKNIQWLQIRLEY